MAASKFDILDYLSGMTNFVFDKSALNNVALDCGVSDVESYLDLTEEQKDRCKIALLEKIVFGVYQTASTTNQHGAYTLTVGAQTITSAALLSIKSELKRLYKKYGEDENLKLSMKPMERLNGLKKQIGKLCTLTEMLWMNMPIMACSTALNKNRKKMETLSEAMGIC